MKRDAAFAKLQTICQRFDGAGTTDNLLLPIQVWLFGSLLTDKPEPDDIDILVKFDESRLIEKSKQQEYLDLAHNLRECHRAEQVYCAGMRMIHIESVSERTLVEWFRSRKMPPDTPYKLIWETGLDWKTILEEIRLNPLTHDLQAESLRKQEKLRGEKRIHPVMQLIRQKYHVEKHTTEDAVFDPIDIRKGFFVCITSTSCPPALMDILESHSFDRDFASIANRKFTRIGRVGWVWDEEYSDIVGLEVVLFDNFLGERAAAEAWIHQWVNFVFDKAGIACLPVLSVDSRTEWLRKHNAIG
jgi:predicted nucleotidyltransferase